MISDTLGNILIPSNHDFENLKIVDFGLAAQMNFFAKKTLSQNCGTLAYMAPERNENKEYTRVSSHTP